MQKTCPKCGAYLANTLSGSLCLKGCGGLFPKVDPITDMRGNGMLIPSAVAITGLHHALLEGNAEAGIVASVNKLLYRIDGMPGIFRRIKRSNQGVKSKVKDGVVAAVKEGDEEVLQEFQRYLSLEMILELCLHIPSEPPSERALQIAARVWQDQEMRNVVMDTDAAEAIARIIDDVRSVPSEPPPPQEPNDQMSLLSAESTAWESNQETNLEILDTDAEQDATTPASPEVTTEGEGVKEGTQEETPEENGKKNRSRKRQNA